MAHDYYCLYCGKKLDQVGVLFDMQPLIMHNVNDHFLNIRFRLDLGELTKLIAAGTPADSGYRTCSLRFDELMHFIAGKNNIGNAAVEDLTIEEIAAYMTEATKGKSKSNGQLSSFSMFDDDEDEEEAEEEEQAYVVPDSIRAIEESDTAITDKVLIKSRVRADFERLQAVFALSDSIVFDIKEVTEKSDLGDEVLTGYDLRLKVGGHVSVSNARICPKCGEKVLTHAGTAKHQSITFVGKPGSGKTSLILALTHYALTAMEKGRRHKIWAEKSNICEVETVEALDMVEKLRDELNTKYAVGIAAVKTPALERKDAYSSTFRIKNRTQDKYYLLTLQDLPGELCIRKGEVDEDKIKNEFPIALSCDAYIACFDTTAVAEEEQDATLNVVSEICNWVDHFQRMRQSNNQGSTFVPTMIACTKCEDLENPTAEPENKTALLPLDQIYMLRDEKLQMGRNPLYGRVVRQFNANISLHKAYHAMMRCSPYGFPAPKDQNPESVERLPEPKNVELLMRWILSVTGSIPTAAQFSLAQNTGMPPFVLNNYCISRPQLRSQNPIVNQEVEESMARCALFENPGYFDREYVGRQGSSFRLWPVHVGAAIQPNTNDRE